MVIIDDLLGGRNHKQGHDLEEVGLLVHDVVKRVSSARVKRHDLTPDTAHFQHIPTRSILPKQPPACH